MSASSAALYTLNTQLRRDEAWFTEVEPDLVAAAEVIKTARGSITAKQLVMLAIGFDLAPGAALMALEGAGLIQPGSWRRMAVGLDWAEALPAALELLGATSL